MIKKILISQPQPASDKSPYYDLAKEHGIEMVFRPFFKVEGISSKEFRQQKVSLLDHTAVVFTSRHAIDNFFTLAKELRVTIPEDMKYFCLIETIALYIQKYVQYRKRKVFFGTTGKIDGLLPQMLKHKGEKFLVPLSSVHNDDIKSMLDSKGLKHSECVMREGGVWGVICWSCSVPQVARHSKRTSPISSKVTLRLPLSVRQQPRK